MNLTRLSAPRRTSRMFFLLLVLASTCACAQQFKVTVSPELYVNPSNVGSGKSVGVKVVDRRPDKTIGSSARLINLSKFEIRSDANVAETIHEKVRDGLRELRFKPKSLQEEKARAMQIEVLRMKESFAQRMSRIDERMQVVLRVSCRGRESRYVRVYKAAKDESHRVLAGRFPNEKLINLTLSLAMQNIFEDDKLIACLSQ
ncbi:MAG: hypothetical protein HY580_06080 [Nitrospinae bacterium]|nr:hypothetical protein [Nitrospinota bacterium]